MRVSLAAASILLAAASVAAVAAAAATADAGDVFAVRLLSSHDVRGLVERGICVTESVGCEDSYNEHDCGGSAARQAAISDGRMEAADATAGVATDLVAIDGGGFFYGAEVQAHTAFHAKMLQAYDAYSLNALDFLANTAASTTLATPPGAIKLTTAGLAIRIEAAGGMPAVLTNYDITVDPFLTRKHITAYTLVALPHSGQTMAVLAVTDPTDLKIRAPDIAARFIPARAAVVAALAQLAQLPHKDQPAVVVLSVAGWQMPTDAETSNHGGGSKEAADAAFGLVEKLGIEVRGIDAILLNGFYVNIHTGDDVAGDVGVDLDVDDDARKSDTPTTSNGSDGTGNGAYSGGDTFNKVTAKAVLTWAGDTEVLIVATGPPLGQHFTDTTLRFVKPSNNISTAALSPAAAVVSNHLNMPGTSWWSVSTLSLGCNARDDQAVARELQTQLISTATELVTTTLAELGAAFVPLNRSVDSDRGGSSSFNDGTSNGNGNTNADVTNAAGGGGGESGACGVAECISGRLVADAMQWYTGADVAFISSNAIKRGGFVPGVLTAQTLKDVLPDPDALVRLESISGETLQAVVFDSLKSLARTRLNQQQQQQQQQHGVESVVETLQASSSLKVEWRLRGSLIPSIVSITVGEDPLDVNRMYTVAVTISSTAANTAAAVVAAASDANGILVTLWRSHIKNKSTSKNGTRTVCPFITPYRASVAAYVQAASKSLANADVDVDADADVNVASTSATAEAEAATVILGQRAWQPTFVQHADLQEVQVGLLCENVESSGSVREECDHALHTIDLINDKSPNNFFGNLLPNVFIDVEEVSVGCSEQKGPAAMLELRNKLPKMMAVIGPPCSGDTGTISHKDRMIQPSGYDGIVLSGGSTAPGLTDGKEYPLLARLATNENDALAPIIAKYGWMKIAILNDDTIWGTGSYDYFSRLFKETSGKDAEILNEDSNTHLRVVDMAAFDADPDGHAVTLLASLKAVDARVIVLIVQQRVQRAIYAAIARTNPFDGKRIALLTTWISVSSMINDDETPNADAMIGSEGLIGISPGSFLPPPSNSEQARYLERWDADSSSEGCITDRYSGSAAKESTRQLPERDWMHHSQTFAGKRARLLGYCDADGLPPLPDFSANIADAVIVLARALDNVLKRTDANAARTSPAEVFAEIQNLKIFQGITGGVKLKSGSEDLAGKLTVVNRRLCTNAQCVAVAGADSSRRKRQRRSVITQRGVDVPVAEYDSAANELLTLYAPNRSSKVFSTFNCRKAAAGDVCLVEFPGGGTEPPLDSTTFKVETTNTRQFSGGTFKDVPKGAANIPANNVGTIRISPLTFNNATTTYSSTSGTSSDVTYTFNVTSFPDGFDEIKSHSFFISAKTGVTSLSFPDVGEYAIDLIAIESSSGQTYVMETLTFTVQEPVVVLEPEKDITKLIAVVGSMMFLFVVVGTLLIKYLTNPIRLAHKRKNDPLSKIGEYLEHNHESLRESVKGTTACKRTFDREFEETCLHDFRNNASYPRLLDDLRDVHARLQAGAQTRVTANRPLIQPTLSFDFETDLNGPEHDATRIATQKRYLADLYKMIKTEEPTAYALLEVITNDVLGTRPATSVAQCGDGEGKASRFGNSTNTFELHRGPLKQMDRILEKADLKKYHFEEMRDYGRASWVLDNVSQLPALLQRLEDGNEFDVVRCKNRFDPEYNTKASGGYRDYQLVLRTRIGSESLVAATSPSPSKLKPIKRWSSLLQATSPSPSKLKPISCQWLYEVQIMTKGFHVLKMGTGLVDSDDLAAHEAYKNFRKFQELCERLETKAKEMKAELDFMLVDNDLALIANVARSTSIVLFKKAKRKSSNKVGPAATVVTVLPPLSSPEAIPDQIATDSASTLV